MLRLAADENFNRRILRGLRRRLVSQLAPIGRVIDDLALLIEASDEGEYEGQVLYLPW